MENDNHETVPFLLFIAIVLLFAILKITESVVLPVVIAIMLSFVMLPIVRALKAIHIPWGIGVIVVSLLLIVIIIIVGTFFVAGLKAILAESPKYEARFLSIYEFFAKQLHLQFDANKSFISNLQIGFGPQINLATVLRQIVFSFSASMASLLKTIMVIILMTAFLLIEMSITREKLEYAFDDGRINGRVMNIMQRIIAQTMRFLSIKFFISLATGLFVYILSKSVSLDFAIVWGFLAFILNFIPTFGSILSVAGTSLFALLQFFPKPAPIFIVLVGLTLINMILGNIIEPRIEGENLGISPFVILVMLSLWGWMWGFLGLIMAVPLTVIIKIVSENIPVLQPIAILLGNKVQDTKNEFENFSK